MNCQMTQPCVIWSSFRFLSMRACLLARITHESVRWRSSAVHPRMMEPRTHLAFGFATCRCVLLYPPRQTVHSCRTSEAASPWRQAFPAATLAGKCQQGCFFVLQTTCCWARSLASEHALQVSLTWSACQRGILPSQQAGWLVQREREHHQVSEPFVVSTAPTAGL